MNALSRWGEAARKCASHGYASIIREVYIAVNHRSYHHWTRWDNSVIVEVALIPSPSPFLEPDVRQRRAR